MPARLGRRLARLRRDDSGFTLLEVVVSVVLFAIVAASATVAVANGIKTSNTTRDRVTAANLAQQQIEMIRASQLPTAVTSSASAGTEIYTITRQVTTPTPVGSAVAGCYPGGTRQVTVTVTWPGAAGRSVRMDTVLAC